mmetsp:Transcript_23763/g.30948  ORF Transcript_23763/g.30948 Transcript_23763/m.30948 type:complete len:393 (+) Transcript_23763:24-1202(+)
MAHQRNPVRGETGIDMNVQGERKRLIVGVSMLSSHLFWLAVSLAGTLVYTAIGLGFYMPYEGLNFTKTIYFLTQTITTVGYGDVVPTDNVSRIVTCIFMVFGVITVAASFSELMYQIFCVHRDRALKDTFGATPTHHNGKNAVIALLEHQITIKQYVSYWLLLEILLLVVVGVILISFVENWDITDSTYWAIATIFTVGYGDFHPQTLAGHWVGILYMFTGCFLFFNIAANLATLPQIYHRKTHDLIVLSQFDPMIDPDTCHINDANEALAMKLSSAHISYSGDSTTDNTDTAGSPMIGQFGGNTENAQIFGKAMVDGSEDNLEYLKQICEGRSEVTRDEFSIWLLHLLGRIDTTDLIVVRDVFDKFAASNGGGGGKPISFKDIESFSGSSL